MDEQKTDSLLYEIIQTNLKGIDSNMLPCQAVPHIFCFNNSYFLSFIAKEDTTIRLYPLFDSTNKIKKLHPVILKETLSDCSFSIAENKFYFASVSSKELFIITIVDSFFNTETKRISIKKILKKEGLWLVRNSLQFASVLDSTVFLTYGCKSWRSKYSGKKCFIGVNIHQPSLYEIVLQNPIEYIDHKRYDWNSCIVRYTDSITLLFHEEIDRVSFFTKKDFNIFKEIDFNPVSAYKTYDFSRLLDLGYKRMYNSTNERNMNIFMANNKIVIIKRKSREELIEKPHFEYLILDPSNNFQIIYRHDILEDYFSRLSFPYKKGFAMLSSDFSNIVYYDFSSK